MFNKEDKYYDRDIEAYKKQVIRELKNTNFNEVFYPPQKKVSFLLKLKNIFKNK
jgi:hypothetical protein